MPGKALYVNCLVSLGFFENEFYVVVDDSSAYVDRRNVRVSRAPEMDKQVEGQVLAYVVEEQPGRALVELPGQAVVGGLRTWIQQKQIAAS